MKATTYLSLLQPGVGIELSHHDRIKYNFIVAIIRATNDDAAISHSQESILKERIELESLANPNDDLNKLRTAMDIAQFINTCHKK